MSRRALAIVIMVIGFLESLLFPLAVASGFSLVVSVVGLAGTLLTATVWWRTKKGSFIPCIFATWAVLSAVFLAVTAGAGTDAVLGGGVELVGWSVVVGFAWAMVLLLPVGWFYAATRDAHARGV